MQLAKNMKVRAIVSENKLRYQRSIVDQEGK